MDADSLPNAPTVLFSPLANSIHHQVLVVSCGIPVSPVFARIDSMATSKPLGLMLKNKSLPHAVDPKVLG